MEEVVVTPPEKIGCFHRSEFSVKDIFIHRQPQLGSLLLLPPAGGKAGRARRSGEDDELSCKGPDRGCYVYYCPKCGEYHSISFGCNAIADYARIAASGTQINGQRGSAVGCSMCLPHRHAVLTLPDRLITPGAKRESRPVEGYYAFARFLLEFRRTRFYRFLGNRPSLSLSVSALPLA